ncbi:MAG: RraA family protein [Sporomusaceae bacterium]|nr:RraA family protein [Sporomusaceae bacterium]
MEKIIEELKVLPATCISDALKGFNHCHPTVKPLKEEYKICGRAVTVKVPAGDNLLVLKAMLEGKPGDILVVDTEDFSYRSFAGDIVIGLAQVIGFGGVVANGPVRDVVSIKESNFPVFCTGATLACSKKIGKGQINVPISFAGAVIHPGDIIVGDAGGIIAVPQSMAQEVLEGARKKLQSDDVRSAKILSSREAAIAYIKELLPEK